MFLSKHSNGTYYIFYETNKGKRRSKSTGTQHKKEALKFLTQFRKKIELEEQQEVPLISVKQYGFQYLRRCEPFMSWNTIKGYQNTLKFFLKHFGNLNLTDFNSRMIEDYLFARAHSVSIFAARKDLINLSALFNKAIKDGYLLKSPTAGIKRIKLPEIQPTFFSKDEFEKLLAAMDDNEDLKDLTIFAINTGFRQMELITLTWNQINFKTRMVILDNKTNMTKSKKVRSMPLNQDAYEILEKRLSKKNEGTDKVFTMFGSQLNQNTLSQHFKKYVFKSNINPKLHFHSLRHTFASWLIQRNVSIYVVSRLLGHADIKTTQIYAHLRTDDMISAVNVLTQTRLIAVENE